MNVTTTNLVASLFSRATVMKLPHILTHVVTSFRALDHYTLEGHLSIRGAPKLHTSVLSSPAGPYTGLH